MNNLELLTSSKARAKMLSLLFENDREYYMREIERETKLPIGSIQQEVRTLKKLDLITARRDGNRLYFQANQSHPLYGDLRQIVIKTSGWMTELRKLLKRNDVAVAFIFGSVAKGTEKASSDIDLFVVGTIGLRALSSITGPIGRKVNREINPHVYSAQELAKKVKDQDHFVTSVLESQKLFLVGNQNEFESIFGCRSAAN